MHCSEGARLGARRNDRPEENGRGEDRAEESGKRDLSRAQGGLQHSSGRRARPIPLRRSAARQSRQRALREPDRNLATALVLGVLRWQIQLDHQMQPCSSAPTPSSTLKS
jgi:hypothetical protein